VLLCAAPRLATRAQVLDISLATPAQALQWLDKMAVDSTPSLT
jgi:hypothetical protein